MKKSIEIKKILYIFTPQIQNFNPVTHMALKRSFNSIFFISILSFVSTVFNSDIW